MNNVELCFFSFLLLCGWRPKIQDEGVDAQQGGDRGGEVLRTEIQESEFGWLVVWCNSQRPVVVHFDWRKFHLSDSWM